MILRSELLFLSGLLAFSAQAAETRASESSRPRGVGPECKKCPQRKTKNMSNEQPHGDGAELCIIGCQVIRDD
jgi:hypothetical protein